MGTLEVQLNQILSSDIVSNCIKEAVGNWTGSWGNDPDPVLYAALEKTAKAAALRIFEQSLAYPNFTSDWKLDVANLVEEALDINIFVEEQVLLIVKALHETHGYTSSTFDSLNKLSLLKIAAYAGCFAYMIAHNLDPELLRMNNEEANEEMQRLRMHLIKESPEKLIDIDPRIDSAQDVIDEIQVRTNPPNVSHFFEKK